MKFEIQYFGTVEVFPQLIEVMSKIVLESLPGLIGALFLFD